MNRLIVSLAAAAIIAGAAPALAQSPAPAASHSAMSHSAMAHPKMKASPKAKAMKGHSAMMASPAPK